jgi:hypothetical protein
MFLKRQFSSLGHQNLSLDPELHLAKAWIHIGSDCSGIILQLATTFSLRFFRFCQCCESGCLFFHPLSWSKNLGSRIRIKEFMYF